MKIPPPSPAEHLQSTLRRFYNREIRDWFEDVDLDDLDINVPRQSLALACRHQDADSALMTLQRMLLFTDVRSRFSVTHRGVGETRYSTNVRRRTRPKITLYFLEDLSDVADGYTPVDGQISVRLMEHTPATITETIARTYATRIKTAFSAGGGFVWKKGKLMCSYSDWAKGYQLQLLCRTESEGRRVVEQVLDIQNNAPDWQNFNVTENAEPAQAFPTVPERDRVYGQTRRQPRRRPVASVRFQMAQLEVLGVPNPVTLVDRSGTSPNPLVP